MALQKTNGKSGSGNPKLAGEIARRIERAGENRKTLATKLGLSYEALRKDLSKNRFFESDLFALCRGLGLPDKISELRKSYVVELKTVKRGLRRLEQGKSTSQQDGERSLGDVFLDLDARMERVRRFVKTVEGIIPDFFECLKAGDVLGIYIADEPPTSWKPDAGLLQRIAAALKAGARITYLYPSDGLVERIAENGFSGLFTVKQIEREFERFKRNLLDACNGDSTVLQNLCLVSHDCPIVCTPQHRYVIYFYSAFGRRWVRSTGTFPIRHKHLRETTGEYQVMDLSDKFTELLQGVWAEALQRQVDKEKSAGEKSSTEAFLKKAQVSEGQSQI